MEHADLILRSRSIFTATQDEPIDGVVVIRGGKVIGVGSLDTVGQYQGAETRDVGDCTIMPSFHDDHLHLILAALSEKTSFMRYSKTEEDAAKGLAEIALSDKSASWLLGGVWDHFRWPEAKLPTAASLDKYFPDRPVFLLNKECHGAWVNSCALRVCGIGKDTPDPPGGKYFRYEDGTPTGYLHEIAGTLMLEKTLADIDAPTLAPYMSAFEKKAKSLGITSVTDMSISGISAYELFGDLEASSDLGIRIYFCPPLAMSVKKHTDLRNKYQSDMLRYSGAKDFMDGTPMGHSGLMIEPYSDIPDFRGDPLPGLDAIREKIALLHKEGIRSRLHACGDMAVRLSLDYYEEAIERYGANGARHTIEHIESIDPNDIRRFKELSVLASVQPEHLPKYDFANHPFHRMIGEARMEWAWPFGAFERQGTIMSFGTDAPVSELTPFRGLFRAITRLTDEYEPEGGFSPQQKLSVAQGLRAYTFGSAYSNGMELITGSLQPNMRADIAILDSDIFNVNPKHIKEMRVIATYMDGEEVYSM